MSRIFQVCPRISFGCLRPSIGSPKVEEMLKEMDAPAIYTRYKVGILFCRAAQSTEEQMYNNGKFIRNDQQYAVSLQRSHPPLSMNSSISSAKKLS